MTTQAAQRPRFSALRQIRLLAASPMAPFYLILASATVLVGLGLLMVLSASAAMAQANGLSPYYYLIRQMRSLAVGIVPAAILVFVRPDVLRRFGWLAWGIAVLLLVLVLTPLGVGVGGNVNWLALGPIQIQPSEFAKLALIVWCAAIFHMKRNRLHEFTQLAVPFIPFGGLILALVLAGRDLGTGIVLGLILVLILWFIGTSWKLLVPAFLLAVTTMLLLVYGSGNRMSRIAIFLDPSSDTDLSSQPISALYALAAGGWWGAGLGAGKQKWGGLKNGAHTDYIFAVLGEELGLFGVLLVIGLFGLLAWAGLEVALRSDKMFNRIVAAGITSWFVVQAIVNIFVVMHLLPVLGVPLPFVSYGGSALMASLMGVGVLLSLARDTPAARTYRASRPSKKSRPRMTSVMAATKED